MTKMKRCPFCGTEYEPVLERKHPEMKIQDEFPNAAPWQREQHISGCCSDDCWNHALGVDPDAAIPEEYQ